MERPKDHLLPSGRRERVDLRLAHVEPHVGAHRRGVRAVRAGRPLLHGRVDEGPVVAREDHEEGMVDSA